MDHCDYLHAVDIQGKSKLRLSSQIAVRSGLPRYVLKSVILKKKKPKMFFILISAVF